MLKIINRAWAPKINAIDIPRDRAGEFIPKIISKYQRDISGIKENSESKGVAVNVA